MKPNLLPFFAAVALLAHCSPFPNTIPTYGNPASTAMPKSPVETKTEAATNQEDQPPKTTWHRPTDLESDSYDEIVRSERVQHRAIVSTIHIRPDNKNLAEARFSVFESDEEEISESSEDNLANAEPAAARSELTLAFPHLNRPLPLLKGQEVTIGISPEGKILYVHYGLIIEAWRLEGGAIEVIGTPYFTKSRRSTTKIQLAPHRIATETDKTDVVVTLMEKNGVQFQNWEGGDSSESEILSSASASEEFSIANLSPPGQPSATAKWSRLSTDQKGRPLANALLKANNVDERTRQNIEEGLSTEADQNQ